MEGGWCPLKLFSSAFGKAGKQYDVFYLLLFAIKLPAAVKLPKPFPENSGRLQKAAPPTGAEPLPDKSSLLLYWLF